MSKVQIFCFHRVSDEFSPAYPPMPVDVFKKVCAFIDRNYFVIPADEIKNTFSNRKIKAVITFDDAYLDFYENALPILQAHKYHAVQHVITQCPEKGETFWTQKLNKIVEQYFIENREISLPELNLKIYLKNEKHVQKTAVQLYLKMLPRENKEPFLNKLTEKLEDEISVTPMMEWKHLKECMKFRVQIGSHTHSHATLSALNHQQVHFELEKSKHLLLKNLDLKDVDYLAFPNGQYNQAVIDAALNLGYKSLFTTEPKSLTENDSLSLLPRFDLYNSVWWKNYLKMNYYRYLK